MEIKEHRLTEFIGLYEKEFGIALGRKEAHAKFSLLLQYVLLSLKPLASIEDEDIINMSNES